MLEKHLLTLFPQLFRAKGKCLDISQGLYDVLSPSQNPTFIQAVQKEAYAAVPG